MEPRDMPVESRMERKKRETRQNIVTVAMDLFERQGFHNTTMEQIAIEADIARKTLYNHFPVKEAIVDEYVRSISKGFVEETYDLLQSLPDTRARLLATLNKVYEWVEINPEITGICLRYRIKSMIQGSEYSSGGTRNLMAEIIRLGREAGEIRLDVSVKMMVAMIDVLRGTIVLDWLEDTTKYDLRKEMAKMVDLVLYGAIDREGNQNISEGGVLQVVKEINTRLKK